MSTVKCLYCDSEADPDVTAGYCEECGKKLPLGKLTTSHSARSRVLAEMDRGGASDPNIRLTGLLFLLAGALFGGLLLMAALHPGTAHSVVLSRTVGGLLLLCLVLALGGLVLLVRGKVWSE
jgi:hypothetical protein